MVVAPWQAQEQKEEVLDSSCGSKVGGASNDDHSLKSGSHFETRFPLLLPCLPGDLQFNSEILQTITEAEPARNMQHSEEPLNRDS